ncbi:ATP-binding protein [Bacillus sp. FJAT-45350]|uniref:ATP-binding protein n=1 Tax=Bacillus sp. FJAT-45350 TaxID=2011014 RepID=UPI000BB68396|nr:ATP-binding protein [Bacillus sp. FJAT-45350]
MKLLSSYKVPIIYILIGFTWIVSTDILFALLDLTNKTLIIWQTIKGGLFVILSGVFLAIILKKKKRLEGAEESRQRLSALINALSDFIVLKDGQGRWIQTNEFGHTLYQLQDDHYSGKSDAELSELYPEYREHFKECVESDEEAWQLGKPMHHEERLQIEDKERIFQVVKVPLFDANNERNALLVIGRDVTEIKQAEELLMKNEKLSVVGQLAAGIAHEIRNPLTSLKGFVQLMRENPIEQKDFYYSIMHSELERINQIVNELLLIAKPQKVAYKKTNIVHVLHNVKSIMETEAILMGAHIKLEADNNLPLIDGEENQLKQVFINIIKNAIEASTDGKEITIALSKNEDNHILIRISDKGCGIPKERLVKIGEPFYTMKEKGTGLGMTVTFKIVHAHNGRITIESEVGKGTVVDVLLPYEK